MTTMPATIIVYATEDQRHPALQAEALRTAQAAQARLIYYDIDAGAGLSSPRPTWWSADTDEEAIVGEGELMDPDQLEAAGRQELAQQVKSARDQGVDAFGWLPEDQSLDTLVDYADEQGASMILVPAELAEASLVERLQGRSLAHLEDNTHAPLVVVSDDGAVETHAPNAVAD